jgi:hypothetical protein
MAKDPVARAIQTAQDCLRRLERDHRQVTANMAAGHIPQTIGITIGTPDPNGRVTWTPTEAAGNLRIHSQASRYQQLINHALSNLQEADSIRGLNVTANTTPLVEQDRCDGGAGSWADPTCERNALNDGNKPRAIWIEGRQHQLCDKCWGRYRQQQSRAHA